MREPLNRNTDIKDTDNLRKTTNLLTSTLSYLETIYCYESILIYVRTVDVKRFVVSKILRLSVSYVVVLFRERKYYQIKHVLLSSSILF